MTNQNNGVSPLPPIGLVTCAHISGCSKAQMNKLSGQRFIKSTDLMVVINESLREIVALRGARHAIQRMEN